MSSQTAVLVSGEGVAFDLQHAGIGSRIVATLIDVGIQLAALFTLLFGTAGAAAGLDTAALQALLILYVVLVFAGYPIAMEWLARGRTVGKMALGLRVVRDDGGPIGLRHAMVRGVAGLVLEKPGLLFPLSTTVGFLVLLFSPRDKRLGDMMAGTFVLNEHSAPARLSAAQQYPVPYALQPWAATVDLSGVDDALALALRQFAVRAWDLLPGAQYELGERLRGQLEVVLRPPPPPGVPTPWVLVTVLAERRRRNEPALAASAGPTYAAYAASGYAAPPVAVLPPFPAATPGHAPSPPAPVPPPSGPFAPPS